MNNRGFTLMELLAVIVIISIILMIVYPEISTISNKNNDEKYKQYEKMMEEYAMVSKKNSQDYIKLSELKDLDIIINPNLSDRECKGYVKIEHDVTPNTYKGYISCKNGYKTTGYNTSFE